MSLGFTRSDPLSPNRCRKRAMDALARREHSRAELVQKLLKVGFSDDTVTTTLDKLADERLQCDRRFAESFVASRYRQGKGPNRIRAELSQKGMSDADIEHALGAEGFDWVALARDVRQRKFGSDDPPDFTERARQMRFLSYRGFDAQGVRGAFIAGDLDES